MSIDIQIGDNSPKPVSTNKVAIETTIRIL
jgi:hypothetical protein